MRRTGPRAKILPLPLAGEGWGEGVSRVIAFGKPAAGGLPMSMCEGPAEPPRRQAAKQCIADPEPHTRREPTSNPGAWHLGRALQRFRVTQHPGRCRRIARKAGSAQTHFALFAFFAVRSSSLRRPFPTMPRGLTARQPPRQSARFSTANNAKNANGPVIVQPPSDAFNLRTRVAGPYALSL